MLATAYAKDYGFEPTLPATAPQADTLTRRIQGGQQHAFESKEHIFLEGDPATDVYRVEAGHVCVYKTMPDGRRQVIDFAYPGDLVGLGAIGVHGANAQAMSRTTLRSMPVTMLRQIVREDARLGLKLYEAVSRELLAAREHLLTVSHRTASERLASFLIALSNRNERKHEDASEFVLPMTRADIADFLGLTIETVSRVFSRLRAAGVIDVDQNILVTILDPRALAELAEAGR